MIIPEIPDHLTYEGRNALLAPDDRGPFFCLVAVCDAPPERPLMLTCARPSCRRSLDSSQAERGASYCRTACRSAAYRERRLEDRSAALDLLEAERHSALVALLTGDEEAALVALYELEDALDSARDIFLR